MHLKHLLIVSLVVMLIGACGPERSTPAVGDALTHYHGMPLPTPDDPVARQEHPPAWLVVGDQVTAGMYLNEGRSEASVDWSLLPRVTLPPGVAPVVVLGESDIRSAGVWTFDLSNDDASCQALAATRTSQEPATYTLAPLTATTPQVLQVAADYVHIKSVSYGWEVWVQAPD
jgi:hypothetical protein